MTVYNRAKQEFLQGNLDLENDSLEMMLVGTGYAVDPDDDFVDGGGASDPVDEEISGVTNYTRKAISGTVVNEEDANDRAVFTFDGITWTELGNGTNEEVEGAILFRTGPTGDTDALLIAYFDLVNFTTRGSDYRLLTPAVVLELS